MNYSFTLNVFSFSINIQLEVSVVAFGADFSGDLYKIQLFPKFCSNTWAGGRLAGSGIEGKGLFATILGSVEV